MTKLSKTLESTRRAASSFGERRHRVLLQQIMTMVIHGCGSRETVEAGGIGIGV